MTTTWFGLVWGFFFFYDIPLYPYFRKLLFYQVYAFAKEFPLQKSFCSLGKKKKSPDKFAWSSCSWLTLLSLYHEGSYLGNKDWLLVSVPSCLLFHSRTSRCVTKPHPDETPQCTQALIQNYRSYPLVHSLSPGRPSFQFIGDRELADKRLHVRHCRGRR